MKTAILVHGCHLQADGWENIVWGNPAAGLLGRVPRALELFESECAKLLYFGTGASEKDGVKESEYTLRFAKEHASELAQFSGMSASDIVSWFDSIAYIDTEAQNTGQEIESAADMCKKRGIDRLILVSSPTHVSRCLLAAEKLREADKLGGVEVLATASDVSYEGYGPADVVIVEPPHRGDRPKIPIHEPIAKANKLGRGDNAAEFVESLNKLLADWENNK